jgi:hypothetical protein
LSCPSFDVSVGPVFGRARIRKPGSKSEGDTKMRFLLYTTGDEAQPSAPPSKQMMDELAKLTEETTRSGVLLATGGLGPAATRVRNSAGKLTVTDGPFTETKELTGGFALVEVKSREEAIEWAKRFRKIVGDGDSLVQEVFGG